MTKKDLGQPDPEYVGMWSAGIMVAVVDRHSGSLWWGDKLSREDFENYEAAKDLPRFDLTQRKLLANVDSV